MNKIKLWLALAVRFPIYGLRTLMDGPVLASIALELDARIAFLDGAIYRNDVRRKLVKVRPISEDK